VLTLTIGLSLMGFIYGRSGRCSPSSFPTHVRYSGSSLTFNLAGILGGALAPYAATWLAEHYGLQYVGLLPHGVGAAHPDRAGDDAGNEDQEL
jgi:fucose permease